MSIETALSNFTPMEGDIIKSQYTSSVYSNGRWMGGVTHFMPGWGYKYYSKRTEVVDFVFAQSSSLSIVTTAEPTDITATSAVVESTVTLEEGNHVFVRGVCWDTEEMPTMDGSHTNGEAVAGNQSITLDGLTPSTTYYVRAYAVTDYGLAYGNQQSFTTDVGEHAYVDLGLPSGLLWATCNLGAETPEDYGDYFAWGETQPKDYYDWSTYQYCMGSSTTLTKYCNNSSNGYNGFTDNLTTLLPEDDAATANWGNDWRMPTKEEWQELYNNTTVTWTTQNGVNGRLFTASNGNSLFLPAAGYRGNSSLNDAGSDGNYWSSSLDSYGPYLAWVLYFDSGYYVMSNGRGHRFCGRSVRPVRVSNHSNVPTGAINGKFTINADGDQVYFSQGNLQYQASTNTWKFADNQYDYVGSTNSNISSTYSGWIDLFGWGTSGYNHGANCYQPWSTSTSYGDYYAYGNYQYNLYDQTGQADWGYNAISNGGNTANQWRTLTQPEWNYVFNTRTTNSGIRYAKANVNDVNGIILLPDDWSTSTYSLSSTNTYNASFSSNTITASQWSSLEQVGAVFLPAACCRLGTSLLYVGSGGYYWTASYNNSNYAYGVGFNDGSLSMYSNGLRYNGQSVRLVAPAEN
jgi:hypothetical protein